MRMPLAARSPLLVRRVTATLLLSALSVVVAAAPPDRSALPPLGPPPSLTLPSVQHRTLSNGLPVLIVEQHEVPVVQVSLVIARGSADDPVGKYGIASLTTSLLTEGAGSRSSLELADAVDGLGADLSASASSDALAVRLHVPVRQLDAALPLMADVALRPTFPQAELERVRQQRLTSLLQARDDAATVASLAFARALYGPSHRFGTAAMGTAASLTAITGDDLRAYYAAAVRPDRSSLIVVGDVSADQIVATLDRAFGRWVAAPGPPLPAVTPPAVQARASRSVVLVDMPGAPQSQIRIGRVGVPRSSADYFPLQIMNTVLGGSFSSRLNMNLREVHGYSYGAGSSFDYRRLAGPFTASAGVQTDKTAPALTEFLKELTAIARPVPDDELARARHYVALRFPSSFETTGDIARHLEEAVVYALPDEYFSTVVSRLEAVSQADVRRVAAQYVTPQTMAIVVAGDRAAIEPGIRALGLGPVTVMTLDEVFGPARP